MTKPDNQSINAINVSPLQAKKRLLALASNRIEVCRSEVKSNALITNSRVIQFSRRLSICAVADVNRPILKPRYTTGMFGWVSPLRECFFMYLSHLIIKLKVLSQFFSSILFQAVATYT